MQSDVATNEIPDISTALPTLMPAIRRKSVEGWLLVAATVLLACYVLFYVVGKADKPFQLVLITIGGAAVVIFAISAYVQRGHTRLIMPMLAETAGMSYSQNALAFILSLPPRLLPKAAVRKGEDLVSGRFGGRQVSFAELTYATGGKNSSTLFKGIVASFANQAPMPPFFIVDEAQTKGWFIFSGNINVDDLIPVRSLPGSFGVTYGVWVSLSAKADHPALDATLKILTELQYAIGSDARLFSASSDGKIMHVALSHKRNLFKIGGLLANRDQLINDITLAYHDLTLPLVIVSKLLEAERGVVQT